MTLSCVNVGEWITELIAARKHTFKGKAPYLSGNLNLVVTEDICVQPVHGAAITIPAKSEVTIFQPWSEGGSTKIAAIFAPDNTWQITIHPGGAMRTKHMRDTTAPSRRSTRSVGTSLALAV